MDMSNTAAFFPSFYNDLSWQHGSYVADIGQLKKSRADMVASWQGLGATGHDDRMRGGQDRWEQGSGSATAGHTSNE